MEEWDEFDEQLVSTMDENQDSYRNMSASEREVRRCFVLAFHEYKCSTRNGDGCGKSITQLIFEAEIRAKEKNRERQLPVITMDHINGNSHQNDGDRGEYCGNLQPLCYSCNRKKVKRSQPFTDNMTREKRDSINIENKFNARLQVHLVAYQHICYKEMLAVGKKWAGGVQITISRHFENELKTEANTTGKFRLFNFECGSDLCNGKHVCFAGDIPQVVIEQKRNEFELEWQAEYGRQLTDEEWRSKFGARQRAWNEKYVGKDQFVETKVKEFLEKQT